MGQEFTVEGVVTYGPSGTILPAVGVTVRVLDRDLPSLKLDQLLGTTLAGRNGAYSVTFGEDAFRHHEAGSADVYVEVTDREGEVLGQSDVVFNPAEPRVRVNIVLPLERSSEYERYRRALAPLISSVPLAHLSAEDVAFLGKEAALERDTAEAVRRLRLLRCAARLAESTKVAPEAFYGWARLSVTELWGEVPGAEEARLRPLLDAIVSQIRREPVQRLQEALLRAVEGRIIPDAFRGRVDESIRALLRSAPKRRTLRLRFYEEGTGRPLPDAFVRIEEADAAAPIRELVASVTDTEGWIEFERNPGEPASGRLQVQVRPRGEESFIELAITPAGDARSEEVAVRMPRVALSDAGVALSQPLGEFLEQRGLANLPALRRKASLGSIEALPVAEDDPGFQTLLRHAELSRITTDRAARTAVLEGGFDSVDAIAARPRHEFVAKIGDAVGDFVAARLHLTASIQQRLLDSVVVDALTNPMTPFAADVAADTALKEQCECEDCTSAVSPLAYLTDLIRYATEKLLHAGAPVDAAFLESNLYQPFLRLPTACDYADGKMKQVRLVTESLRAYLGATAPDAAAQTVLDEAEAQYRLAAYRSILQRIGTSYEEVRLARPNATERAALAGRLGIVLSAPAPGADDEVSQLFLDPHDSSGTPRSLTENNLEILFGIASTLRDPLSAGAKLNDPAGQLGAWRFERLQWGRDTSPDGSVFITLTGEAPTSSVTINVFADRAETRKIASVTAATTGSASMTGSSVSALKIEFGINYSADTAAGSPIEIVAIPRVLSWRLAKLRELWLTQDADGALYTGPVIDPDIVPATLLADPIGGPAATLWQQRYTAIQARLTHIDTLRGADPTLSTAQIFDNLANDTLGIAYADLNSMWSKWKGGAAIDADLAARHLKWADLQLLVTTGGIAQGAQPITESEWLAVTDILLQAWKRARFAQWRTEEQTNRVTLSPDHFHRPSGGLVEVEPGGFWRAPAGALRTWLESLDGREDQVRSVTAALVEAVAGVEELTLTSLRDALIAASDAVGADMSEKQDWMALRLLVDTKAGGCQQTTRVAHAIEALQTMLSSVRSDKPVGITQLSLVAAAFDEEWRWMGSYATWRGAMFVYLYPENILLPSLWQPRSPAFDDLLSQIGGRLLSTARASSNASAYAAYFEDVCALKIGASCAALTRVRQKAGFADYGVGYRCLLFLFGLSSKSGSVYCSTADPANPGGYPQRFWERVPFEGYVTQIIGAQPYELPTGQRYVYVFAKTRVGWVEQLSYCRLSLETHEWDPARLLPLPDSRVTQFTALLVSRTEIWPGAIPKVWNYSLAPQLVIRMTDPINGALGYWYERQMAEAGDSWEPDGFGLLYTGQTVVAVADQGNNALFVIVEGDYDVIWIQHRLISPGSRALPATGRRYTEQGGEWLLDQRLCGVLLFQNIPDFTYLTNRCCILTRSTAGTLLAHEVRALPGFPYAQSTLVNAALPAGIRIPSASGSLHADKLGSQNWFGFRREDQPDRFFYGRVMRNSSSGDLNLDLGIAARPPVTGPFDIAAPMSAGALQIRRQLIGTAYTATLATANVTNERYLHEAYYLVPVAIALELSRAGEHQAAFDWFRLAYDFNAPVADRKIAHLLKLEETLAGLAPRAADWLLDPLSPHKIAATRRNAYTRFTIASIAEALRAYADAEFTKDDPESLSRARRAYEDMLSLLEAPEVIENADPCNEAVDALAGAAPGAPMEIAAVVALQNEAKAIRDPIRLVAVIEAANELLTADGEMAWSERAKAARTVIARELAPVRSTIADKLSQRESTLKRARRIVGSTLEVDNAVLAVGKTAAGELDRAVTVLTGMPVPVLETARTRLPALRVAGRLVDAGQPLERADLASGALPHGLALAAAAGSMPEVALDMLNPLSAAFLPSPPMAFCMPPNPTFDALRDHARINLLKLRTCRNIAGMTRHVDAYAAPTDTTTGLPVAIGGSMYVPGAVSLRPTQYRYSALIERAKQLAQIAAQMEASMMQAIETAEAMELTRFKAEQDIGLTIAHVQLQSTRLIEANDGIGLAELQQKRAQDQADTFTSWIQEGMNELERQLLEAYNDEYDVQADLADSEKMVALYQALTTAATGGLSSPAAAIQAALVGKEAFERASSAKSLASARRTIQGNAFRASIVRRQKEWELQKKVAEGDIAIGAQTIKLANDRVAIVTQEKSIAELEARNARDTLEFLRNRFLGPELLHWVSRKLEHVYGFFLQQATAIAELARQQLAFERQQVPPVTLQTDYWSVRSNEPGAEPVDRRGLTGSARLLEDIYRLDQYAFTSNPRKLQVSRTLSLAQLYPLEFARFRETGVLAFETQMGLFDRDFPGHYLRLLKGVRLTVVALVPPSLGIKATLTTSGISRTVIGPDPFQVTTIRRDPESVAFTAPVNSNGMFELNAQPELLMPFEGGGVEAFWEFRMPKAANPLDYRTIADILVAFDFTALDSIAYRDQVIRSLPQMERADRAFSFRNDFADAWYDLHNPEQVETAQQMKVAVRLSDADFPPNVSSVQIESVVLYFARAEGFATEVTVDRFTLTPPGAAALGGAATTVNSIISSRAGNGSTWVPMVGKSPNGVWTLEMPNTNVMRAYFKDGSIQDILLIVSYRARTASWPT